MKNIEFEKALKEYLKKGVDILSKEETTYSEYLSLIKKQLEKNEISDSENEVLAFAFLILFIEKKECEKKLMDVTNSYDEVLGLITHEFKNILTSIHGYNMLLEKRLNRDKDIESVNHLADSDRLTRQLFDMTNSLLKMSLGEKGLIKPDLKLVDFINDLIVPIKRDLSTQLNNKQMTLAVNQLSKNVVVECDEGLMDIVLRNLFINAIKYGKQKTEINVSINRQKNEFSVAIKNASDNIPGDLCDGIFEKFKSRKIGMENGGTGIGLYNVRNIIQLHNGTITCKCVQKKWVEFLFSIPQSI
jgi:signal transduction histidine kinase